MSVREFVTDGTDTDEDQTMPSAIGATAVVFRNAGTTGALVACSGAPTAVGVPPLAVMDGGDSSPGDDEVGKLP